MNRWFSALAAVRGNLILCVDDCFQKISREAAGGQMLPLHVSGKRSVDLPLHSETCHKCNYGSSAFAKVVLKSSFSRKAVFGELYTKLKFS